MQNGSGNTLPTLQKIMFYLFDNNGSPSVHMGVLTKRHFGIHGELQHMYTVLLKGRILSFCLRMEKCKRIIKKGKSSDR